jgi:hypothetical protein
VIGRKYYLPVIERIRNLETSLEIDDAHRLRTTPEQGGDDRKLKISHMLVGLFVGLGVIDIGGIVYVAVFR